MSNNYYVTGTVTFTDPDLTDRPVVTADISATDPSGFQEYDDDVRETPDWEPSPCWYINCWWAPPRFPRPNYVIRYPSEPKIPPSRATPEAVQGPAVLAETKKPWSELPWYQKYVYLARGVLPEDYETKSGEQIAQRILDVKRAIDANSMSREVGVGSSMSRATQGLSRGVQVTAEEIRATNRALGGVTELTGKAETVIANMAYREGATAQAATAIRDIAGRHLFNDANKRTAQAVAERILGSAADPAKIRSVIDRVGTGDLKSVEDIASALGH